jgi:hypothetical protein
MRLISKLAHQLIGTLISSSISSDLCGVKKQITNNHLDTKSIRIGQSGILSQ